MVKLTRVPSSSSSSSTVTGLILTLGSPVASPSMYGGSSLSRCDRTAFWQSVLTNVVRPVPEAPQTMTLNWIPFFTFFLRRSLGPGMLLADMMANADEVGVVWFEVGGRLKYTE